MCYSEFMDILEKFLGVNSMTRILTPSLLFCLVAVLAALSLNACSSMTPAATRRSYCKMLKSDIVFNSATSVTRQANIDASNAPLQEKSYEDADCAQYDSL
jgi:hypothetical protein